MRKIVILAREAEYKIEQADVVRNEFIPHKCFNGTVRIFKTAGAFNADLRPNGAMRKAKGLNSDMLPALTKAMCRLVSRLLVRSTRFIILPAAIMLF